MDDKEMEKEIRLLDCRVDPPAGLQEKLLDKIITENMENPVLTPFEKFIFEKPLQAACAFSFIISGSLWMALGSNFSHFLLGILG